MLLNISNPNDLIRLRRKVVGESVRLKGVCFIELDSSKIDQFFRSPTYATYKISFEL